MAGEKEKDQSEPIEVTIGANLRRHRESVGLTQDDVMWHSGLHRSEVSMIELGKRKARVDTLLRFAGAIGISPAEAFRGAWPIPDPGDQDN